MGRSCTGHGLDPARRSPHGSHCLQGDPQDIFNAFFGGANPFGNMGGGGGGGGHQRVHINMGSGGGGGQRVNLGDMFGGMGGGGGGMGGMGGGFPGGWPDCLCTTSGVPCQCMTPAGDQHVCCHVSSAELCIRQAAWAAASPEAAWAAGSGGAASGRSPCCPRLLLLASKTFKSAQ